MGKRASMASQSRPDSCSNRARSSGRPTVGEPAGAGAAGTGAGPAAGFTGQWLSYVRGVCRGRGAQFDGSVRRPPVSTGRPAHQTRWAFWRVARIVITAPAFRNFTHPDPDSWRLHHAV